MTGARAITIVGVLCATVVTGCATDNERTGANAVAGSPGWAASCEIDSCERYLTDVLQLNLGPRDEPGPHVSSECKSYSAGEGEEPKPACECVLQDEGVLVVGRPQLECSVYGKGGDCLSSEIDEVTCEPGDREICEEPCRQLDELLAADARRSISFDLRYAECDGIGCLGVVEIAGRCYQAHNLNVTADLGCSRDDEELVRWRD